MRAGIRHVRATWVPCDHVRPAKGLYELGWWSGLLSYTWLPLMPKGDALGSAMCNQVLRHVSLPSL